MTVSSSQNQIQALGDGASKTFAIPFYFLEASHIEVVVSSPGPLGVPVTLTPNIDYTVFGAGNQMGGSVKLEVAPLNTYPVTITRNVPATQLTDYQENDDFPAASHERALDKLTMLIQQAINGTASALRIDISGFRWDFLGLRGINLGDPISPADAVNKRSMEAYISSILNTGQGPINNAANVIMTGPDGEVTTVQNISSTTGGRLIGLIQSYTGSVQTTLLNWFRREVRLSDFGPAGSGGDDTPYFILARNSGKSVELDAGKTYRISSQIAANGINQGWFVRNGWATVVMLTGAGKFDRSTYSGTRFDANACAFYNLGFSGYIFKGIRVTMEATSSVRTIKALAVRGASRANIDVEVYGFKECENGIVCIDNITASDVKVWGHDCGTSNDTLASMQITVLDMDNTRTGSTVFTTHTKIKLIAERVLLDGAALTKYGHQTDGFNASASGGLHYGVTVDVTATDIGEACDVFGSHMIIRLTASRCWFYAMKFIHGAQHNVVDVTADTTGGAAVVFGGSNVATQPVAHNTVRATVSNCGNLSVATPLRKCALQTDGDSATFKPTRNYVTILSRQGGNMDYVVCDESGTDNIFTYDYDVMRIAEVQPTANSKNNAITRLGARRSGYTSSGRYYAGGLINLSSTAALALSANTLYFSPFEVTEGHIFISIGSTVTAAGSGVVRYGIYRMERGVPTVRMKDCGEIVNTAVGVAGSSIESGAGIYLVPGMYALAMVSNTTMSIQSTPYSPALASESGLTLPSSTDICRQAAFSYAGMPAIAPSVSFNNINVPNIWLRG